MGYPSRDGRVVLYGNRLGQWLEGDGPVTDTEISVRDQNRPNWFWWKQRGFKDDELDLPVYEPGRSA